MDREIIVGNAASVLYQCSFVLIAIILVEFDTGSIVRDNQFFSRVFLKKTPTSARLPRIPTKNVSSIPLVRRAKPLRDNVRALRARARARASLHVIVPPLADRVNDARTLASLQEWGCRGWEREGEAAPE